MNKSQEQKNSLYKIMVVEKDKDLVDALSMSFKSSGYNFICLDNTNDAIKKIRNEHYDLMLLNFVRNSININKNIEEIRNLNHDMQILLTVHNKLAPPLDTIEKYNIQGYWKNDDKISRLLLLIESTINSIKRAKKNQSLDINLKDSNKESIENLRHMLNEKDPYTRGHSDRVAAYSVLIGKKLGLPDKDIENLRMGGLFHDVAKIGVPDNILFKSERLTDDEYQEIKNHPSIGANLLSNNKTFSEFIPIVKFHHERYDGKGYPYNLKGEEIPYLARITSIADTFDAMTSTRTYRKALPLDVVKDEFKKNAGIQFDPQLTSIFLEILENNEDEIKNIQNNNF